MAFLTPSSTSCSLSRTQITVFPVRTASALPLLPGHSPTPWPGPRVLWTGLAPPPQEKKTPPTMKP